MQCLFDHRTFFLFSRISLGTRIWRTGFEGKHDLINSSILLMKNFT